MPKRHDGIYSLGLFCQFSTFPLIKYSKLVSNNPPKSLTLAETRKAKMISLQIHFSFGLPIEKVIVPRPQWTPVFCSDFSFSHYPVFHMTVSAKERKERQGKAQAKTNQRRGMWGFFSFYKSYDNNLLNGLLGSVSRPTFFSSQKVQSLEIPVQCSRFSAHP